MRLSLSVRVAESFTDKTRATMGLEDLARLAKETGYGAVCMRASQAGVQTPPERLREMRETLDGLGLTVSMVTGDFAIPQNSERGPEALRRITPHLDVAEAFGADLIRVCMKREEDIAPAQRAADEAGERGIRLAHQCHTASLFETAEGALEALRRVGRPNFRPDLRAGQPGPLRAGLRAGDDPAVRAPPVQCLRPEPPETPRRTVRCPDVGPGGGAVRPHPPSGVRGDRLRRGLCRAAGGGL